MLLSVPFTDDRIWKFLSSYYEGRIPREKMEDHNYNIVKCKVCQLIFQEFILSPSNMYLLYEEWISAEKSLKKKKFADIDLFVRYAFEVENICRILKKKPNEINVLDYGMGWGYWSAMAKAFGLRVVGVEISKRRIDFATKNGLKFVQDISQEPNESFNYIHINMVFEHLANPKEVLNELTRVLSPQGIIYIRIPNDRSLQKKLRNPNWKAEKDAIQPLEHINCFNRKSLKIMANQAGLKLIAHPYNIKINSLHQIFKNNARYIYDLLLSTKLYFVKT